MGPVRYLCAADPACALAALVAAPATTFLSSAVAEQAFTVTPRGTTFAPQCTALAAPGSSPAGRSIPVLSQGTAANAAASQHNPWPVPCRATRFNTLAPPGPPELCHGDTAQCQHAAHLRSYAGLLDLARPLRCSAKHPFASTVPCRCQAAQYHYRPGPSRD